jgi:glycosyltransferase involved in cell wall biosynthesis
MTFTIPEKVKTKDTTKLMNISFIMELVAGHTTHYHNLRKVISEDPGVKSEWYEVVYRKEGGWIEKIADRAKFLPYYPFGISRASLELYKSLRGPTPDAIFTNAHEAIFFNWKFKNIPTVYNTDATPLQIDNLEGYDNKEDIGPLAKLKYNLFRNFANSCRLITAWSEWARQSFIKDYGVPEDRVVINPPGIMLDYWQYHERQEKEGPVRILFVGGDFKRKNGPALLEWFNEQPSGTCVLDIVTREQVEPQDGVFVHYNMKPNTPELMQLYRNADIFVLPSLGECFGIATVEAMATGLPVVVSDVGGTADIVDEGVNGYIIPAKNNRHLNAALQTLLTSPEKRRIMGLAGRQKVEERFDAAVNARKIVELLGQISNR